LKRSSLEALSDGVEAAFANDGNGTDLKEFEVDWILWAWMAEVSWVFDFLMGSGYVGEEDLDGDVERGLGCQRPKTEPFPPAVLGGRDLSGDDVGDGKVSNCALTLTIFWTNPRPWSRLRLGVRSFWDNGFW
jgi:hypothetical protein